MNAAPAAAPAPPQGTRAHVAWLMRYWRPHWRFGAFLVALTLLSAGVTVAWPLVLQRWLDRLEPTLQDRKLLFGVLTIMGAIALGRLLSGLYPAFRAWMNLRVEVAVRQRLFGSILKKDHAFFGRHRTGDLVTRLTDDISDYPRIAWFACSGFFRFLDSSSKFVLCIALMLVADARLAGLALLPVPIMLFVFYRARHALGETYERQQVAVSRTNDLLESAFSGIRIVKAFNADEGQRSRLATVLEERIGIQLKLAKLHALIHQADAFASRLGQVLVLVAGGWAVIDGRITVGTLFAIYLYLEMLVHPMMDLPNLFVTARQAFVSIDRVDAVVRDPSEWQPVRAARPLERIERLELEGVTFRHRPDAPPALDGLSLHAVAGERIAVVGSVASGKSTLLRLLAGLLPPDAGAVRVNGEPWPSWSWDDLRGRIGYVPQESTLFSETIADNVAFGREAAADRAWVERCLHIAQMDGDLAQLGGGIETRLGRGGTLVSGGQKQRVAIARALAGRPDLLLFDDCTASLDARNEDRFWGDLAQACPEAITVFVSHRLATIRRADRILVLARGKLVDEGTHDELADRCEDYRGFLMTEARREHLRDAFGAPAVAAGD